MAAALQRGTSDAGRRDDEDGRRKTTTCGASPAPSLIGVGGRRRGGEAEASRLDMGALEMGVSESALYRLDGVNRRFL